MLPDDVAVLIKRCQKPDEVRTFEKGQFELIKIGGMTIGRATYEPGWKWSQHVAPVAGTALCQVEHIGMVISGQAACAMADGRSYVMKPGDIFYIGPGHDSWVVGDEPYVSLHFLGGRRNMQKKTNRSRFEIVCAALHVGKRMRRMAADRYSRTKCR